MSITAKFNIWFDQFLLNAPQANKTDQELWTLHVLDSVIQLFQNNYKEIPIKPATSKVHTFLDMLVHTIRLQDNQKKLAILYALYLIKNYYSHILKTVQPAEYYLNYLPHNYKVFYVDLISILYKFPEYKYETLNQALLVQQDITTKPDAATVHKTNKKISELLASIPYNTDFDRKLAQAKEIIFQHLAAIDTIYQLAEIVDELSANKYDYLRKDKNLLRTLTGTFTRNNTWAIILNEIKQKTLEMIKKQLAAKQIIDNEVWNLAESILTERAQVAALFKDHYLEELALLRRKYSNKIDSTEKDVI